MRLKTALLVPACLTIELSASAIAEIPDELQTSPLAEAFGTAPAIGRPRLSPDGSKIDYLQQDSNGIRYRLLVDFASDEQLVLAQQEEEFDITW
jgi:hypothetical protein